MTLLARFSGGVHPNPNKTTAQAATQVLPRPQQVVLPLRQHIGAPCQPLVKKGDHVDRGQPVGDADAPVSAPVHASVSGTVAAVEPRLSSNGRMELSVVVDVDPEDTLWTDLPEGHGWHLDPTALDPALIRTRLRQAGLVGMGGAGFPTAIKVNPKPGSEPDVVILNGCECEPSITSDHRLMVEEPERVVLGLRLIMQATGAKLGIIAVEANKPDAAAKLSQLTAGAPALRVEVLPVRYPQGAEKMLVWAILRRAVPIGGIPLDVGVVVQNVATAAAAATALAEGLPLVERIVTVSGSVASPGNWRTPLGASFSELVAAAGGITGTLAKVIAGGPMMGTAQPSLEVPVTKTTGSVILWGPEDLDETPAGPCIRCGRCVTACPMGLIPAQMADAAQASQWDAADRLHVRACLECGSCSYVCPARRPLVQSFRLAKFELGRRARQGRG